MTSSVEFSKRLGGHAPRGRWHWSFADLAALAALLVALVIGVQILVRTEGGRATIADQVEQGLSDGIRGYVTIGRLDRVGLDGVEATNVTFFDESGRPVIEAEDVMLAVDWSELAGGRFISPRGTVHGGRIWLETVSSGDLLIDRAFEPPTPGPPNQPVGPDFVRLEALVANDVELIATIRGSPGARASHVSAICLVRAPENGAARMRADRIDAAIRLEAPIPIIFHVEDGSFELDGASARRAHLELPTESLDATVRVHADAAETMHVSVLLAPRSVGAVLTNVTLILQALVGEMIADTLDVSIDVQ